MKKMIALLLAATLMLALCACGGGSYTAVPELKLSWDMDPEAAQQSCSCKTVYQTRDDSYSFVLSAPDQKLPEVAGVPLNSFMCVFDNDRMIQVILFVDAAATGKNNFDTYNYKKVVELFTKEYGKPTESFPGSSNPMDGARTVWILDTRAIEIQSGLLGQVQRIVFYAGAAEETVIPEEPAEPTPVPEESSEPAPETGAAEAEKAEEEFASILKEELPGTWICVNDMGCELTVSEDGSFSFDGQTYLVGSIISFEEGQKYIFNVQNRSMGMFGWMPEDDVIYLADLPGLEKWDFAFFYSNRGLQHPCEPFFGTWTLSEGTGLTRDGSVVQTITITPGGELLLDDFDVGLTFAWNPGHDFYRWVINHLVIGGKSEESFRVMLQTKDPFADPQDEIWVVNGSNSSYYRRS